MFFAEKALKKGSYVTFYVFMEVRNNPQTDITFNIHGSLFQIQSVWFQKMLIPVF